MTDAPAPSRLIAAAEALKKRAEWHRSVGNRESADGLDAEAELLRAVDADHQRNSTYTWNGWFTCCSCGSSWPCTEPIYVAALDLADTILGPVTQSD